MRLERAKHLPARLIPQPQSSLFTQLNKTNGGSSIKVPQLIWAEKSPKGWKPRIWNGGFFYTTGKLASLMGLYQLIIIWFGFHACEYQFNELLICSVLATNRYRKAGSANFLNDESKAKLTALFKRLIELFRRCSGCGGGSEAWTGNISASNSASIPPPPLGRLLNTPPAM